jgi:hypothetical protein
MVKATSNWIFFWDVDDLPDPIRAVELLQLVDNSCADVVVASATILRQESQHKLVSSETNLWWMPGIWRVAFSANLIRELKFQDWQWGEDQLFLAQALLLAKNVTYSSLDIYTYYASGANSLTSNHAHWQDLLKLRKALIELLENNPESLLICGLLFKTLLSLMRYGDELNKSIAFVRLVLLLTCKPMFRKILFFEMRMRRRPNS